MKTKYMQKTYREIKTELDKIFANVPDDAVVVFSGGYVQALRDTNQITLRTARRLWVDYSENGLVRS